MSIAYCTKATPGNEPVRTICAEMARRFGVSEQEMLALGDSAVGDRRVAPAHILQAAIALADREYRDALPQSAGAAWQPPRADARSFVRFLDAQQFRIPWYFEDRAVITQVRAAVATSTAECIAAVGAAECVGLTARQWTADALARLWLRPSAQGGWGIRGDGGNHPERSPDRTVRVGVARCSEWTVLHLASAVIASLVVRVQLSRNRQDMHLEPYVALSDMQLWNVHLPTIPESMPSPTLRHGNAVRAVPLSDVVVGIAINRAVTAGLSPVETSRAVRSQLPFGLSPTTREWINAVLTAIGE